jgi:hypothetical protein
VPRWRAPRTRGRGTAYGAGCLSIFKPHREFRRSAVASLVAMLTLMAVTAVLAIEIGWLMSDPVFRGK